MRPVSTPFLEARETLESTFEAVRRTGVAFVTVELELVLTFLRIASQAANEEKRFRNIDNARTAYAAAMHALARLGIDEAKIPAILDLERNCKYALNRLGDIAGHRSYGST